MVKLKNSFSDIAHIYHRFNDNEAYQTWVAFTLRQCQEFPTKALDVACGNGILTNQLSRFTESMTGIDYDPKMIEQAKKLHPFGNWQVMNMLDLSPLDTDFDLVTCYLDSLCFLASEKEIRQAIHQMYQRLKSGGILLFDVWTQERLLDFDGFIYADSYEDMSLIWQSEAQDDGDKTVVIHHLIGFEREGASELYHKLDVTLTESSYPLKMYLEMLQQAGFDKSKIGVYPDFSEEILDERSPTSPEPIERWCIKAIKS